MTTSASTAFASRLPGRQQPSGKDRRRYLGNLQAWRHHIFSRWRDASDAAVIDEDIRNAVDSCVSLAERTLDLAERIRKRPKHEAEIGSVG